MKIRVTLEDIEAGEPQCADECPVARAITRLLNDERSVWVFATHVNIDQEEFAMPAAASDFVVAFDRGKPVEPIEFELPIEGLNRRQP